MNKKYIFLCLALLFGSCTSLKKYATEKTFLVYGFDFTEYANKGFLFTPLELIDRPYEGRGMIRIDGYPEVLSVEKMVEVSPGKYEMSAKFYPQKLDGADLIKKAYELAVSMRADAIISFRISNRKGFTPGNVEVEIQEVYGFAIKRL